MTGRSIQDVPAKFRDEIREQQEVGLTGVQSAEQRGRGLSITWASQLCQGKCRGQDDDGYSTRAAHDSPARIGRERGTGRKVIYCPCCMLKLVPEKDVAPELKQRLITNVRPPNLAAGLVADHDRFVDIACLYDTVVLRNIRPI